MLMRKRRQQEEEEREGLSRIGIVAVLKQNFKSPPTKERERQKERARERTMASCGVLLSPGLSKLGDGRMRI